MWYIVDIFINIAERLIEVQLTLAYNVLFEMFEYILEILFLSFGDVR